MKHKAIWISYDFGLKGDYMGLYTWLDNNKALECGTNLAYCSYDLSKYKRDVSTSEIIENLLGDFKAHVKLSKSDRVYIIWKDTETKKVKGEFISGGRKQSPWEGYGKINGPQEIDTAE